MKYIVVLVACLALVASSASIDAFVPELLRQNTAFYHPSSRTTPLQSSTSPSSSTTVIEVPTKPISGMKPGTSGLRKKVEVWQAVDPINQHYLENFIQSLLNTAIAKNDGKVPQTIIVAGDGRYYNNEAIQIICRILAGNGVTNIWIPTTGIMSTPAVSATIRRKSNGICDGGIVLTASHNPGGPGEDFGIKYNLYYGQPAGEDFTDDLYKESLIIDSFKTISDTVEIDINARVGTSYTLGSSTVTMIDPFTEYVTILKECFDFDALRSFLSTHPNFSMLFDGMHGAGGPFAKRVLVEELGLSESSLLRCDPRPDFGKCHPDPNLIYAAELITKMGLLPDGSADPNMDPSQLPTLGAANDGDGDRNLIAGAGFFVTPSDSLALICDNWEAIPHFAKAGGPKGVARSMPSSAALDVVAKAKKIPCFVTPTGWKFFGNLMSSKEMFGKTDYTPFLCGEESFGTGSDHIREKDGLWAALAWMSILMKANKDRNGDEPLVSVRDIVLNHWSKYGRHFYCRYDYEGVDSEKANNVINKLRDDYVNNDFSTVSTNESVINLVSAEEFSYTDPVDGSQTSNQGIILNFEVGADKAARVVFRLSGTGSSGATIRVYFEQYDCDVNTHNEAAPVALKDLADYVITISMMKELTGRDSPTVIT